MPQPNLYTDDELLEYLKVADSKVNGYLSSKTYRKIKEDGWPSPRTLWLRFGSWKEAKQAAGLPARGQTYSEKSLSGKDYYDYVKDQLGCSVCDESFNSALAFHHPPEAEKGLGNDIAAYAPDRIKSEVESCIITCFNCHQKHHSDDHELNLNEYETINPPSIENARAELI